MSVDAHANFGYSTVAIAPSPDTSGTTLSVVTGTGVRYPAVPFNCTVWPAGTIPLDSNAEIVRVTNIATDLFTITRAQEGTSAKAIAVGYQIANTITAKVITDIEPGRLIGVQILTTPGAGTYTPTDGTNAIVIELVGGGGGGGGADATAGSNVLGMGGAAGGYVKSRHTSLFSGAAYVIGAAGSGGAAGNNNGSAGEDTTFTLTDLSVLTGGGGGAGDVSGSNTNFVRAAGSGGFGNGGIATGGTLANIAGDGPYTCISFANGVCCAGHGGGCLFGGGGAAGTLGTINTSTAGGNAGGFGAGGAGGVCSGTGPAVAGGNGSAGKIVIYEYS